MTGATTWHGRRGTVVLGPTEHRTARYLSDLCRAGQVTIPTMKLAAALGLERSEAYRILRRLRVLGLFGIANDPGGHRGGRRIWRTSIEHDGAELNRARHAEAWSRIIGWARARQRHLQRRLAALRAYHRPGADDGGAGGLRRGPVPLAAADPGPADVPLTSAGPPTFTDRIAPYATGWLARRLEERNRDRRHSNDDRG